MEKKLFVLFVGINQYASSEIPPLKGCIEDITRLEKYMRDHLGDKEQHIVVLQNQLATYSNVVKTFREHFSQAGPGDVCLFHYSGHGSREPSAPEFKEFYPEGWDETLVCYDSRPSGMDLADKELAVLVDEVAARGAHVLISLDSCHSGSGTRSTELRLRQTSSRTTPRSLDSYLDGYYTKYGISIPTGKHLLMASCDRYQTAADGEEGGLYSSGLLRVLTEFGHDLSYADIFLKTRHTVTSMARKKAHSQSPQFEAYGHFDAYSKFLDGSPVANRDRYPVTYDGDTGSWVLNIGAVNGLPVEADKVVELAVYKERLSGSDPIAMAQTTWVGSVKSGINVVPGEVGETFFAEIISMPVPPFPIFLSGDEEGMNCLKKNLEEAYRRLNIAFTSEAQEAQYGIYCFEGQFLLKKLADNSLVIGTYPYDDNTSRFLLDQLEKVVIWERSLVLNNNRPKLNPDEIEFNLFQLDGGKETLLEGNEPVLYYSGEDLFIKIKARNNTAQDIFYTFLYYSDDYSIHVFNGDSLAKGLGAVTLYGGDEEDSVYLEEGDNLGIERFRLLITTEKTDDFLLEQEGIEHLGEMIENPSFRKLGKLRSIEKVKNDWFFKTLTLQVQRKA